MSSGFYCVGDMNLTGNVTFPSNSVFVIDGGIVEHRCAGECHLHRLHVHPDQPDSGDQPASIGNVDIDGGATLHLSAPLTTAPSPVNTYAGIMIYQDRRAVDGTEPTTSQINGNSGSVLPGRILFPEPQMTFNGTAGMSTNCMCARRRRVTSSGNKHITNTCPADSGGDGYRRQEGEAGRMIRCSSLSRARRARRIGHRNGAGRRRFSARC